MPSALQVANYLVRLAAAEDEPEGLSPMRVQKLLYYVQGWSLAQRGEPMFPEPIEAWALGPVVPAVYRAFKDLASSCVPVDRCEDASLPVEDADFVNGVWEVYKPYSAIALSRMTHDERPWKETRGALAPSSWCDTEISCELMGNYFRSLDNN